MRADVTLAGHIHKIIAVDKESLITKMIWERNVYFISTKIVPTGGLASLLAKYPH